MSSFKPKQSSQKGNFFLIIFVIAFLNILLVYLFYQQHPIHAFINNYGVTRTPQINIHTSRTIVRVVPLISDINLVESDGAPKYRFLRQQGLKPSRKFPDALIIGVKKGGTRALLEFIRYKNKYLF